MSKAALFHPDQSNMLPEHITPPAAVADIVEEVHVAWLRVAQRSAHLRALRAQLDDAPRIDRDNARRAAAVDDSPPESVTGALKEMYAEAERAFGGALVVCVEKMAAQSREMLVVRDEWLTDLRAKHAARVPAIRHQIAQLSEEFIQLADDAALIEAVERIDGNPKATFFTHPDERREARQRARVEQLVRASGATVERSPAHLLAALDYLSELAITPPAEPAVDDRPLEARAAGVPGGGSAAW